MSKGSILCSWSGGKDSCYALMKSRKAGYTPAILLNVLNEEGKISRSHGIPSAILSAQAVSAGLPLHLVSSSWQDYESHFSNALTTLKTSYGITHAVFGDIDLQPHRDWEEKICAKAGLIPLLPLWQHNRKQLVMEMLETGIETIIVSCNTQMGENYLGKQLTRELVAELEMMGIDPCGENGEFHTLVCNCPLFSHPLSISLTATQQHDNYWFSSLALTN